MLRDAVGYTCEFVLKTAQETGESVGIIGKSGKIGGKFWGNWGKLVNFGGNRGKLGGNSGEIGEKLVKCVSPMVKQKVRTALPPPHLQLSIASVCSVVEWCQRLWLRRTA